jgi:hypothetical protein
VFLTIQQAELHASAGVGETGLPQPLSHHKVGPVLLKPALPAVDTAPRIPLRWALRASTLFAVAACSVCAAALMTADSKTLAIDRPAVEHALLRLAIHDRKAARVHRFRLPVERMHAEVVDLRFTTPLADALGDGDLIVNGGFWGWHKTERRVLGLLASRGRLISPLRAALDGGVLLVHAGQASIVPSRRFNEPHGVDLAVQCRPRLLQAGKIIPDLNAQSRAARTAVCVRESGRTLDVYVTEPEDIGPSLHELGVWLATEGCEHALNLDGGPSTAAAFRDQGQLVRIGAGRELPYALRFTYGTAVASQPAP